MLQKAILIAGISIFSSGISAQNFNYGICAGMDLTNTHATNSSQSIYIEKFSGTKIGFNVNAYGTYKSTGPLGFTIEPGFIQKGMQESFYFGDVKSTNTRKFNYIQLPITADFYFNEKLSVSAGPEIAYLLRDTYYYTKFEVSVLAGVNYTLTEKLKIGLRYNHGLTPIISSDFTDANGNKLFSSKTYNQYFQLNAKYQLN